MKKKHKNLVNVTNIYLFDARGICPVGYGRKK